MKIFTLLKEDHKRVEKLFKKIDKTKENDEKEREELFVTLLEELTAHTELEEKYFYPLLEKAEKTSDLTLEAEEEHKLVKSLLQELDTAPKGTSEWQAKFKVLKENVQHHVEEEEKKLFKQAKMVLSNKQQEKIAEQGVQFKKVFLAS